MQNLFLAFYPCEDRVGFCERKREWGDTWTWSHLLDKPYNIFSVPVDSHM